LTWQLQLGGDLEKLQKLQDAGRNIPMLDSRPELTFEASHFLGIFQDLNMCRPRANGSEPITAQEIYYYCELHGIVGVTERSEIFDMIKYTDGIFMDFKKVK